MSSALKVITFLSGRGSNFKGLLSASRNPDILGKYTITDVLSDKPGAPGLYYAKEAGIPVHAYFRSDYPSLAEFKKTLFEKAESLTPDLITLAGFMHIVPEWYIEKNAGKIINIHPSLLPAFPGLKTHERAIQQKAAVHGCTVHFVDNGVDTGAVIAQVKIPIMPTDTADTLAAKVLIEEHRLYPWVVSAIARGLITLSGTSVIIEEPARDEAARQGFILP